MVNLEIIFKFPAMVRQEFIILLCEFHSSALVVYAYFACVADVLGGYSLQFCDDWAERTVRAIAGGINDAWKEWVRWPEEQLGKRHVYLQKHTPEQSPTESDGDSVSMEQVLPSHEANGVGGLVSR